MASINAASNSCLLICLLDLIFIRSWSLIFVFVTVVLCTWQIRVHTVVHIALHVEVRRQLQEFGHLLPL